jgi:hypothetical protein
MSDSAQDFSTRAPGLGGHNLGSPECLSYWCGSDNGSTLMVKNGWEQGRLCEPRQRRNCWSRSWKYFKPTKSLMEARVTRELRRQGRWVRRESSSCLYRGLHDFARKHNKSCLHLHSGQQDAAERLQALRRRRGRFSMSPVQEPAKSQWVRNGFVSLTREDIAIRPPNGLNACRWALGEQWAGVDSNH